MPLQRPWGFFGTGSDLFKPNSTGQLRSRQRRRTCHWNNHRFSSNRTGKCNRLRKRNHRFHSQSLQTNAYRNYKKKENTQRYGSLRNENIEKEKRRKKEGRIVSKRSPCVRVLSNQQKENKLTIKEQQRLVANFVPLRTKTETRKSKREKRKNDKDDTAIVGLKYPSPRQMDRYTRQTINCRHAFK